MCQDCIDRYNDADKETLHFFSKFHDRLMDIGAEILKGHMILKNDQEEYEDMDKETQEYNTIVGISLVVSYMFGHIMPNENDFIEYAMLNQNMVADARAEAVVQKGMH